MFCIRKQRERQLGRLLCRRDFQRFELQENEPSRFQEVGEARQSQKSARRKPTWDGKTALQKAADTPLFACSLLFDQE